MTTDAMGDLMESEFEAALTAPEEPRVHRPTFDPGGLVAVAGDPDPVRADIFFRAVLAIEDLGYTTDDHEIQRRPWNGRSREYVLVVRGVPALLVDVRHEGNERYVVTPEVLTWPRPAAER